MGEYVRLQKFLASAGVASRRECEKLIVAGHVHVNGEIVLTLGSKIDPECDKVEVYGMQVEVQKKRVFLFYKPINVITSMSDKEGRKTVADFFKQVAERVYPVGRLDFATEGLLLLTNDGNLANLLMHPRYKVSKTYRVEIVGHLNCDHLEKLRRGVMLSDGLTAPAKVRLLGNNSNFEIVLKEGRNRQIRRMCEALGHKIKHLVRTKIAHLTMDGLKRGQFKELSSTEVAKLIQLTSLEQSKKLN